MIRQIFAFKNSIFKCLKENHYTRKIKSNFEAYGGEYEFCRFYEVVEENLNAIICIFNSSMVVSTCENFSLTSVFIADLATFISMNKPDTIEVEKSIASGIFGEIQEDYSAEERTDFEFREISAPTEIKVDELPKLDEVYKILAESFPTLKNFYHLWLTDTSHRIRRGLSQAFLVENYTTATIQYIVDNVALVGHVATLPEYRGKFHARELLYWLCDKLSKEGLKVHLFARENRVSYYKEIGFIPVYTDMVFERKLTNE